MSVGHLCIDWRRESAIDIVTAYLAVSMRLRRENVGQCVTPELGDMWPGRWSTHGSL